MKKLVIVAVMACLPVLLGADQRAKTPDGKEVILRDDGTWVYANEPGKEKEEKDKKPVVGEVKDPRSKVAYQGKRGTFTLSLVPDIWKKSPKPTNEVAEVEFSDKDKETYAMVIAERISVPLEKLKETAVENMKEADKDAVIVKEEKRTVNGKPVLAVIVNVKTQGLALTFYSYYYSGEEGSIQVMTWTVENLFEEMKPKMEAFLNGFEVVKK